METPTSIFEEPCAVSERRLKTRLGSRANKKLKTPKLKTVAKVTVKLTQASERDTG